MDVRQPRSLRRALFGAVVAVAASGLLAGCGLHPGSAAVIDGRSVSTADVAATIADLSPVSDSMNAQTVIGVFITEPALVKVAADHGVSVSDDDVTAMLDELFTGQDLTAPSEYSDGAVRLGRYVLLAEELNARDDIESIASEYGAAVEELDVEVNPRFGTYDLGTVNAPTLPTWVVESGSAESTAESTAEPTATATATPSATPTATATATPTATPAPSPTSTP